jgi:hypothetical protein
MCFCALFLFSSLVAPLLVMVELISRNSLPLLLLYLYALLLFGLFSYVLALLARC